MRSGSLCVAICTYNSAPLLPRLLRAVGALACPVPYRICVVDNNSTDGTESLVRGLAPELPVPLQYVREPRQGIPYARNRAIEEAAEDTYLAFIDSDELPRERWLAAAHRGLHDHGAECVGGRIQLDLPERPPWLADSLLPFLGQVDHGGAPFTIADRSTPVWSGNVAYRTTLFADGLRFDTRYNRAGTGIGGGSDGILFRVLLERETVMRYEPEMAILHLIPPWKLRRGYFLRLHFKAGIKEGRYQAEAPASRTIRGVPRYLFRQLLTRAGRAAGRTLRQDPEYVRELMNLAYHLGLMRGYAHRAA